MKDHPAAASGAKREKLHVLPYDLVPFQEMTEAYVRVAEFGAKKYTEYWESECQGLSNVSDVVKIEISLPEKCAKIATTLQNVRVRSRNESHVQSVYARSVPESEPSRFSEQVNAADVMKNASNQRMLTITLDKRQILGSTTEKTKITGSSNFVTEQTTRFLESAINEQNFSHILEILESRNKSILNTEIEGAPSANPLLIFTLTTITGLVFSEEFFAHDATTVSDFWATISRALKKHSLIYGNDVRVSRTGCWNWSKGLSRVQILGSLLRHTFAYLRGEETDKDSGLSHTDHILWNAVALAHNVRWNLEDGRRVEPLRGYKLPADDATYLDHVNADGTVTKVRIDPDEPLLTQVRAAIEAESDPGASLAGLLAYARSKRDSGRLEKDALQGVLQGFGLKTLADAYPDQVRPLFAAIQAAERHDQ